MNPILMSCVKAFAKLEKFAEGNSRHPVFSSIRILTQKQFVSGLEFPSLALLR